MIIFQITSFSDYSDRNSSLTEGMNNVSHFWVIPLSLLSLVTSKHFTAASANKQCCTSIQNTQNK